MELTNKLIAVDLSKVDSDNLPRPLRNIIRDVAERKACDVAHTNHFYHSD